MAHYPETGWNYSSPEELGIATSSPRPMREMAQMARGFQNLLESNQGRGVYTNTPLSAHRGKAYEKVGFEQVVPGSENPAQFLDNRRFKDSKALAEVYLKGDIANLDIDLADATARGLLNKHLDLQNTRDYVLDQQELKQFMQSRGSNSMPYYNEVSHYNPSTDSFEGVAGIEVTHQIPEHNYYPAIDIEDRYLGVNKLSPDYVLSEIKKRGLNPQQFIERAYRDYSPEWGDRFADMAYSKRAGDSRLARQNALAFSSHG